MRRRGIPENVHRLGLGLLAQRGFVRAAEVVLVDLHGVVLLHAQLHVVAEPKHRVDVGVVLLDLLAEAHGLVVLRGVDVLGPAALYVVHALAEEFGALSVYLMGKKLSALGGKTIFNDTLCKGHDGRRLHLVLRHVSRHLHGPVHRVAVDVVVEEGGVGRDILVDPGKGSK